jgi:dolichyl-phosphate beta-glucosyltransferase
MSQTAQHSQGSFQWLTSLSIVIPAFNEEKRLPPTLKAIADFLKECRPLFSEIIVVDDGSSDGTVAAVRSFARGHGTTRLLSNPGNRGKGYSVRHGAMQARGDWVLITDADLSSPIDEVQKLASAAARSESAIAIGSRALDRSLIGVRQQAFREWSGRVFNLYMRLVTGLPFKDTQCGFKLYRADAARFIFSRQTMDGFSFDVEDLYIASKGGFSAVEVPVRWNNADGSTVTGLSGLRSFVDVMRIRRLHRGLSECTESSRQKLTNVVGA